MLVCSFSKKGNTAWGSAAAARRCRVSPLPPLIGPSRMLVTHSAIPKSSARGGGSTPTGSGRSAQGGARLWLLRRSRGWPVRVPPRVALELAQTSKAVLPTRGPTREFPVAGFTVALPASMNRDDPQFPKCEIPCSRHSLPGEENQKIRLAEVRPPGTLNVQRMLGPPGFRPAVRKNSVQAHIVFCKRFESSQRCFPA